MSCKTLTKLLLILTAGMFLTSAPTRTPAQTLPTTATVAGVVRDSNDTPVPDAVVTLRELATNQTRRSVSDEGGAYRISSLPVGSYEVLTQASGFADYVNPKVTVVLGQTATLDITLQPAGVNEQVEVTDKPLVLDTGQTASTTAITEESIEELPVNSRNYLQFTVLAPGVVPSPRQSSNGVNVSNTPLLDSGFSFGGLRPRSNSISIDGLTNTDETTGSALVALSPEIVREFQVINNGVSAEFGGSAGGAINVVTKTGSNQFHGTAFTFFQNEHLNARSPFDSERLPFRRYQPGASLGGPILHDKLFFYAAAEQENFVADERSDIDPVAASRINTALASGSAPRLRVRRLTAKPFRTGADETELAGKLTYLVNSFNTVNLRAALTNNRQRLEAFNTDAFTDQSARGSTFAKDYQLIGSLASVLTPKLVNDLRLQISRRHFISRSSDTVGPGIEIVGVARFGEPFDADTDRTERRTEAIDAVAFTRGAHELKTGFNVNHVSLDGRVLGGFAGIYIFRTLDDFLMSRPSYWRQAFGARTTNFSITSFGTFLQDRWQATPKFTLNLGLRYDNERLPEPFHPQNNNFSPRLGAAWSPSKDWVVRAGFGIFYDRFPLAFLASAIGKDGSSGFEQFAYDTRAEQIFAASGGGAVVAPVTGIAPSIYRAPPEFNTPYSVQMFAGFERVIAANTTARAEFLHTRGIHLSRTRNVNLLRPVTLTATNAPLLGISNPTPQQLGRAVFGTGRVDPAFDAFYQLENSASSTYNSLLLSVNDRLSEEITFLGSYTLSKTTDDASDYYEPPANPYDLRSERSRSLMDVRHRLVLSGVFELPFGDEDRSENDSLVSDIFGNIEIAPIITLSSGRPVGVVTGSDEERSGAFPFASRPLGFSRNELRTPKFFNTDLRIVKYVPLGGSAKIDFAFEFFNLFNRPNAAAISGYYGSGSIPLSSFAQPVIYNAPRQFRFSIDLEF